MLQGAADTRGGRDGSATPAVVILPEKGMEHEIAQTTHQGDRPANQDRGLIVESPDALLLAIADGMGGHPRGDQAAQYAVDTCGAVFRRTVKPISDPISFLREMFAEAHRQVVQFGRRQRPPIHPRTTCTVALLQSGLVWAAHVGDSRLYVLRRGETLFRTRDHSYVEKLYTAGVITGSERSSHPRRNSVTRCLGGTGAPDRVTVSEPFELERGDVVLLCTDGLWGAIDEGALGTSIREGQTLAPAIEELARRAAECRAPSSDNVTAVALRWLSERALRSGNPDLVR